MLNQPSEPPLLDDMPIVDRHINLAHVKDEDFQRFMQRHRHLLERRPLPGCNQHISGNHPLNRKPDLGGPYNAVVA